MPRKLKISVLQNVRLEEKPRKLKICVVRVEEILRMLKICVVQNVRVEEIPKMLKQTTKHEFSSIVRECSMKNRHIYIVTEYMRHGYLLNYLRRHEQTLNSNQCVSKVSWYRELELKTFQEN